MLALARNFRLLGIMVSFTPTKCATDMPPFGDFTELPSEG
jgi:hypothetical protein